MSNVCFKKGKKYTWHLKQPLKLSSTFSIFLKNFQFIYLGFIKLPLCHLATAKHTEHYTITINFHPGLNKSFFIVVQEEIADV